MCVKGSSYEFKLTLYMIYKCTQILPRTDRDEEKHLSERIALSFLLVKLREYYLLIAVPEVKELWHKANRWIQIERCT